MTISETSFITLVCDQIKIQKQQQQMAKSFVKMHGAGNDFILLQPSYFGLSNIRSREDTFSKDDQSIIVPIVQDLCSFHFGVGADGVLIISQTQKSIYKMSVYNADGSFAKMCGNGLRCAAAYISSKKKELQRFVMLTDGGQKEVSVQNKGKHTFWVQTNLGKPTKPQVVINNSWKDSELVNKYIKDVPIYKVSIGNSHLVIFMNQEQFEALNKSKAYQELSLVLRDNQLFNVNFCHVDSSKNMKIITVQLGAGVTFACGTGSAASTFAGYHLNLLKEETNVHTRGGGVLVIKALLNKEQEYEMMVSGPAKYVFSGTIED